ncbi:hypothetical protein [Ectobacillus funiculus]|uniref:hypothetical protein n=1 Tax=Ectobacillus funiculus TaxID=137993 RepID=UPI00101C0B5B|nr:hypothetical protein [Ectobacillus funiculus]
MNWERKALEHIIAPLVDQDIKFSDFTEKSKGLGIQLNLDGTAYKVLRGLTDKLKCNHGTSRGFKKHSESDLAYKNINVLGIHTA